MYYVCDKYAATLTELARENETLVTDFYLPKNVDLLLTNPHTTHGCNNPSNSEQNFFTTKDMEKMVYLATEAFKTVSKANIF